MKFNPYPKMCIHCLIFEPNIWWKIKCLLKLFIFELQTKRKSIWSKTGDALKFLFYPTLLLFFPIILKRIGNCFTFDLFWKTNQIQFPTRSRPRNWKLKHFYCLVKWWTDNTTHTIVKPIHSSTKNLKWVLVFVLFI